MAKTKTETHERQMLFLVEKYKEIHGVDYADPDDVAGWLLEERRYVPEQVDPRRALSRKIARALRAERYTDPQCRDVRVNHPVVETKSDGTRHATYHNILIALPEAMRISLTQRRDGIRSDCKQHAIDFGSYNDNNIYDATLESYDYNFNADLEELRQPSVYLDERPDHLDGEDADEEDED